MNAPLSLFLTRFSPTPPPCIDEPRAPSRVTVVLTEDELDARLAATASDTRAEADAHWIAEIEALKGAHAKALEDALAAARAEWIAEEAETLSSDVGKAMGELREMIADRAAAVLRPFVVDAVTARTRQELSDALDRLLADPTQPTLEVRGPQDLLTALQARHAAASITWSVAEACDVEIVADATRVETCLRAALAELVTTEA